MTEKVLITISYPAFSCLLHENVKSQFDQEGFLLGEISEREVCTTTDNEQFISIEKTVKIDAAIPCPKTCYFYNSVGQVNSKKLKEFLGKQSDKVVAWYKFKQTPPIMRLSLREKIIHKELCKIFSAPSDLFTMCLLVTNKTDNHSTHSYSQTFVRYLHNEYQPLPMQIINLSETNGLNKFIPQGRKVVDNIVKSLKVDVNNTQGFIITKEVHNAIQKCIDRLPNKSAALENKLFELEEEIKKQKRILSYKLEQSVSAQCSEADNSENKSVENGINEVISSEDTTPESKESSPETRRKLERKKDPKTQQTNRKRLGNQPRNSPAKVQSDEQETRKTRKVKSNISYSQAAQAGK